MASRTQVKKAEAFAFSQEQLEAIEAAITLTETGGFMFITGKAGTGKSTIMREIKKRLEYVITLAPTGLAATNVGGVTIHSFFKLRPGPLDEYSLRTLGIGKDRRKIIRRAGAILLDEISMVRADVLDAVDHLLRRAMETDRPFGGKAVIAFGDLHQIEPIVNGEADERLFTERYRSKFFFDALCLRGPVDLQPEFGIVQLSTVFRQQGDPSFIEALNKMRAGDMSCLEYFNSRVSDRALMGAVWLTCTNRKADAINQTRLRDINAESFSFRALSDGDWGGDKAPADHELKLKVGARVMTIANRYDGESGGLIHANGDLGYVTELDQSKIVVELDRGGEVEMEPHKWERLSHEWRDGRIETDTVAQFVQFPVRLAWAVTIHKCQGQTYDRAHLRMESKAFSHGQTYVALSRCKTAQGMTLARPLTEADIIVNDRIHEFWEIADEKGLSQGWAA